MNGSPKPVFKIQQTPKGEWHLKRGMFSYGLFETHDKAIEGMMRVINNTIYEYNKDGSPFDVNQ